MVIPRQTSVLYSLEISRKVISLDPTTGLLFLQREAMSSPRQSGGYDAADFFNFPPTG